MMAASTFKRQLAICHLSGDHKVVKSASVDPNHQKEGTVRVTRRLQFVK